MKVCTDCFARSWSSVAEASVEVSENQIGVSTSGEAPLMMQLLLKQVWEYLEAWIYMNQKGTTKCNPFLSRTLYWFQWGRPLKNQWYAATSGCTDMCSGLLKWWAYQLIKLVAIVLESSKAEEKVSEVWESANLLLLFQKRWQSMILFILALTSELHFISRDKWKM